MVRGSGWLVLGLGLGGLLVAETMVPPTAAQRTPRASNMDLVGYNDLQARSAYQPLVQKQGNRWIAYVGHHGGEAINPQNGKMEPNGTSIVDVTDPKNPKYLFHIPGEPKDRAGEIGGASMVRVCSGNDLPHGDKGKFYLLRAFGNTAHEIWDVTDPAKPSRVTVVVSGLRDTHKNWWECDTGIAYLVSGPVGWRVPRMMQIYDLSDPAKPVFIRNFGLPGQEPGAKGPTPGGLHGAFSTGPKGNRVYMAYDNARNGVIEILDREKLLNGPKEPTEENLRYPIISRVDLPDDMGAHNIVPMLRMPLSEFANQKFSKVKDFILLIGETTPNECNESRQMGRIFDVTTESKPVGVSTWTVPEDSGNFCSAGGRRSMPIAWCSWRTLTPACAPSTSAIPTSPRKSGTISRPSAIKPTSAAWARVPTRLARRRFRPTTSTSTTAATSMPSTAPTLACTSLNSPARRGRRPTSPGQPSRRFPRPTGTRLPDS